METKDIISIQQFCIHYNIPISFITSLNEFELIKIITIQKVQYINITQIKDIEKMIRLHYELDINIEGIDVVYNLLKQVKSLQHEIKELDNRLKFHEGGSVN
jgi:hypothetical protein